MCQIRREKLIQTKLDVKTGLRAEPPRDSGDCGKIENLTTHRVAVVTPILTGYTG